ncbi:hypothetical protein ACQEVG_18130 [Streptomyces sp. CA-135486]|uniref:hypothetical protein n=1 Tax=Streptomyces sp. CA-135486 TaxID=3240049 RepID=UPI003D91791E
MTSMHEEIAEQQADITRLLLHHIHAPLPGGQFIRGVLPAPSPVEAIRIVTSAHNVHAPNESTVWEIPLRSADDPEDLTGPDDILGILRALHTGTHIYSSDHFSTVMGMPLIHVDPATVTPIEPTAADDALTILRTLIDPYSEEQPDPRLRGFLLQAPERLRLYLDTADNPDVTAADVRPSGAVTALLAALPSLITEEERTMHDDTDPHCSRLVDLTRW